MQSSHFVRRCFTLALCLAGLLALGSGCSSDDQKPGGAAGATGASGESGSDGGSGESSTCAGGECDCDDSECDAGERCVQGECRPACSTQDDCPLGQNCATWEYPDTTRDERCVVLPYAEDGGTGQFVPCTSDAQCDTPRGFQCIGGECQRLAGLFEACSDDDDCDAAAGFACIEDTCRAPCSSHFDCGGLGGCESFSNGNFCSQLEGIERGGYYTACPGGVDQCDTAAGFTCLGYGEADLDAFCTTDCGDDGDCPEGFRCGTASATPCEDACGETGDATAPGCIPSSEIGEDKQYRCGSLGLVRSICVKRNFCSSCETDADCRAVPGQICARDESGEKICTVPCLPSADSCPWGNAARCAVFDEELGFATCSHKFGACHGEGKGCEPCVDESDCPSGFCARSSFTQEQYCIDLTPTCDCGDEADASGTCRGGGCPDSPGGPALTCLGEARYEGDPLANRCLGATISSTVFGNSPQTGCWSK